LGATSAAPRRPFACPRSPRATGSGGGGRAPPTRTRRWRYGTARGGGGGGGGGGGAPPPPGGGGGGGGGAGGGGPPPPGLRVAGGGGSGGMGRSSPWNIRPRHNHLSSERRTKFSLSGKVADSIGLEALFLFLRRSVSVERLPYGQICAAQMGEEGRHGQMFASYQMSWVA